MPKATLPTTPRGWLIGISMATVGLLASFVYLRILERLGIV